MVNGFTGSGFSLPPTAPGDYGVIARLTSPDADALRELRAMGLRRGASIRIVNHSPKLVVRQGNREVTLSKRLSRAIHIRTKSAARYW
jgi:Fe2+ transport system protein FeoA